MLYVILCNPGHNRVYYNASLKLSVSEFIVAAGMLSVECGDVQHQNICGVDYLSFQSDSMLTPPDIRVVSELSFVFALFCVEIIGGETYFKPVELMKESFMGSGF